MSESNAVSGAAFSTGDEVSQVIGDMVIPPCPRIIVAMMDESRRDEPDLLKLDKLICGDMGLASAVIKTANSPFYGLNHKVQAVRSALQVLGIRTVASIVTVLALRKAFSAQGADPFWDQFWDRANYHAIACARLAKQLRFISAEGAFTFGLFNECGIPIMAQRFADYRATWQSTSDAECSLVELERTRYQVTHAQVGLVLARSWQLPDLVCDAVRDHHDLERFFGRGETGQGDIAALSAISLIADYVVNDFLGTPQDAEWLRYGEQVLDYLGLDHDELEESQTDILGDLQEAQAYRS